MPESRRNLSRPQSPAHFLRRVRTEAQNEAQKAHKARYRAAVKKMKMRMRSFKPPFCSFSDIESVFRDASLKPHAPTKAKPAHA
jgi:hypothetical protein